METATARPTIFISYNGADRAWAEWIAWVLEEDGYKVVIQAWNFRPGSNFVLEMDKATGADKTVLVLSDNYLRAEYTHPEWAAAFARDPQGVERRVVPVRVAPCSPSGLLAQIVWADLVGLSEPAARQAGGTWRSSWPTSPRRLRGDDDLHGSGSSVKRPARRRRSQQGTGSS